MQRLLSSTTDPSLVKRKRRDISPAVAARGSLSWNQWFLGRLSRLRARLYVVFIVIIATLLALHIARLNPRIAARIWRPPQIKPIDFHVLIPATKSSPELCQTLLTGAILNYPTPTLVNWGKTFNDTTLADGGFQLANIYAIEEWVMRLRPEQRGGMLLILNDQQSWFQLRPNTLLERYKMAVRDSNVWTKQRMERAFDEERIGDHTLFGSRKTCEPNVEDQIGCYPQPQSPLSSDTYGENTDTTNGHTSLSSFRPRYLSSSVILGPIDDLRQITAKAFGMKDDEAHNGGGNAQYLYNTMFGQQEFQRQVFRARHLSWKGRLKRFYNNAFGTPETSILDEHPSHEQMEHFTTRSFDYGIGVDYVSSISHDVADSEHDVRFIVHSDKEHSSVQVEEFDCTPHLKSLPHEISSTYVTSPRIRPEVISQKTWADLPLYTNMCTGNVPVIIHNTADSASRERLWRQFWMQPMARDMFTNLQRYAYFESPEDNTVDIGMNLGGAVTDTGEKLMWDELCGEFEQELFRGSITHDDV